MINTQVIEKEAYRPENNDIDDDITDEDDVDELPLPSQMMSKKQVQSQSQAKVQPVQPQPVPKKRTRTMSKEALEALQKARLKAIEVKKNSKKVNEELEKVRKETYGEKVHEVETYKKIKERVDSELKQNEIVNINKKLDDMYNRFNSYLDEKTKKKDAKKAYQIAQELPLTISKQLLEEELKKQELERFRKRIFGY